MAEQAGKSSLMEFQALLMKRTAEITKGENNTNDSKAIKMKDGKGDTVKLFDSKFGDNRITHWASFPDAPSILKTLTSYDGPEDDIWMCNFPKSGSHWFYELCHILVSGRLEPARESCMKVLVDWFPDASMIQDIPHPRIFLSHFRAAYIPDCIRKKRKILHLMRNPKSVAVSFYNHHKNLSHYEYSGTFEGYQTIVWGDDEDKLMERHVNGTYLQHTKEWWEFGKHNPNVKPVFYEDIMKRPHDTMREVATFLGIQRDDAFYDEMVKLSSFDVMKKGTGKLPGEQKAMDLMAKSGVSFFRKGTIDSWKEYFTPEESARFDEKVKESLEDYPELLERFQYE